MHVLIERERTGEGEDASSLTVRRYDVPETTTVLEFLHFVRDAHTLPGVLGGRATWVAEGERPLAVVTQEYREPWMLVGKATPLVELAGRLPKPHVFFRYLAQRLPEDAYRGLGGDPVRLTRDEWKPSREITWTAALRDLLSSGRR